MEMELKWSEKLSCGISFNLSFFVSCVRGEEEEEERRRVGGGIGVQRKIDLSTNTVTRFIGKGSGSMADGEGTQISFYGSLGIVTDLQSNQMYLTQYSNPPYMVLFLVTFRVLIFHDTLVQLS
jgi:hypothetical protein